MTYDIISTGSKGNAVVINGNVLIDCGISYSKLKMVVGGLKLVLLTHIHTDHFQPSTVKLLAKNRPTLRFACGSWLVEPLLSAGVKPTNIDIVDIGKIYHYKIAGVDIRISPVKLYHDVPNYGYRVYYGSEKLFYATDTARLDGITAKGYNLYMIEADYEEAEMQKRIEEKRANGEYIYEIGAMRCHLSKQQADNWLYSNMERNSQYVYLHCHEGLILED